MNIPVTQSMSRTRRRSLASLLFWRIWLPRWLYAALPYLYLLVGTLALASGLFLPEPGWAVPYLVLIGLAGVHGGLALLALRRRWQRRRRQWDNKECTPASQRHSATSSPS